MNKFKIFLAVNNNVVSVMPTMYVNTDKTIFVAHEIVKDLYPELENKSFTLSYVNTKCFVVTFNDLVAIVEQI